MSNKLRDWAKKQSLPGGAKGVLIELCDRANDLGICFPSQKRIADDLGISIRTVSRHINALEKSGYIERERRQKGYIRRSDSYMIKAPIFDSFIIDRTPCGNADTVSSTEQDRMYSAEHANLAEANADRISVANKSSYKKSYKSKQSNYIKILDQEVYIADRGTKNNPEWITTNNFTLYRTEYRALEHAFPCFSEDQLYDLLTQHDNWLENAAPSARSNWLACLCSFLKKYIQAQMHNVNHHQSHQKNKRYFGR